MRIPLLTLSFASVYLAGCSVINPMPGPDRPTDLYSVQFQKGAPANTIQADKYIAEDGSFRALVLAASAKNASASDITAYLKAGFSIADETCSTFFNKLSADQSSLQFMKNQTTVVGGLAAGLMGIFRAGTIPTAATAAGFAALGTSLDNINTSFLLVPNVDGLRDLVTRSRGQIYNIGQTIEYSNFSDAHKVLTNYEDICSTGGLKRMINDSVKTAFFLGNADGTVFAASNTELNTKLENLNLQMKLKDIERDRLIQQHQQELQKLQQQPAKPEGKAQPKPEGTAPALQSQGR